MSRTRTRERRQQRDMQRKRQRQISIVIGAVIVAVVALALVVLVNQPAEAPLADDSLYADLPVSLTDEGFPLIGEPDAPVVVYEYSSFDCPACAVFHSNAVPQIIDRVRAGDAAFVYVPLHSTGSIANGLGAARAAVCAAEQDAFWPYHSSLFTWQQTYGNTAFAGNRLSTGIDNLGIDRAEWDACMSSRRPDDVLVAANASASRIEGFRGTPTVVINGQIIESSPLAINGAIDIALASAQPPVPPVIEEETPEAEASGD